MYEKIERSLGFLYLKDMSKAKFSVGETVWALWPGSKKYYEAEVLELRKNAVYVNFKDGFKTEVPMRQTFVRLDFFIGLIKMILSYFSNNQNLTIVLERPMTAVNLATYFARTSLD